MLRGVPGNDDGAGTGTNNRASFALVKRHSKSSVRNPVAARGWSRGTAVASIWPGVGRDSLSSYAVVVRLGGHIGSIRRVDSSTVLSAVTVRSLS